MADTVLTDQTTTQTMVSSDFWYIGRLTTLTVIGSEVNTIETDGVTSNITLVNDGTIVSLGDDAIFFGSDTSGATLVNGATGVIRAHDSGILLAANAGDASIVNYGEIYGDEEGVFLSSNTGSGYTLSNFGALGGGIFGVLATNQVTIVNDGTLIGTAFAGIFLSSTADLSTIENTGSIMSTFGVGISSDADDVVITNSGSISGTIGIFTSAAIVVNNSGTITSTNGGSALDLSILADLVINSGLINGDVILDAGDDIYQASGTGWVSGEILGGLGNDTLTGAANADFIDGGDDNDRLFGRGGDDDLRGGLGSDFISAGTGDDFVLGDNGADRIFGGGGEDTLQGGRDLDTIRGGDGDDEINGGRSADILRGGAGADTFLYQFRQDSTINLSDRIQDFEVGVDVIDVSGTASQLSFVGSAAFSGAGNEVRYEIGGNGRTFVEVDTDANGSADMRILLGTVGALTEDDFVL